MGYEDPKVIIENIASLDHDNEKIIEIYGGASELGVKILSWLIGKPNAKVILIAISKPQGLL